MLTTKDIRELSKKALEENGEEPEEEQTPEERDRFLLLGCSLHFQRGWRTSRNSSEKE